MSFGFTYTLPTITGSHTDFPVLLIASDFPSAAIDGTGDAIDNGGGNLVAYTSSAKTTQLPVEVVTLVSSGTPEAEVWIKIPIAATGNTIFFEASATQSSQPAVTSTFGRNAVWADYLAVLHLNESGDGTAGEYIDSTGNGFDGTGGGGTSSRTPSQVTTDHPWGANWQSFDGVDDFIEIPTGNALDNSFISVQAMAVIDVIISNDEGLISNRWSTQGNNFYQISSHNSGMLAALHDGSGENNIRGTKATVGAESWYAITTSSSEVNLIFNGAIDATDTSISGDNQFNTNLNTRVGTYFDSAAGRSIEAKIGETRLRLSELSESWYATEFANQDASTAWGTVGTWADSGGGPSTSIPVIMNQLRNQGIN